MAFSLAGKTAIVTGAGSGINLCFARLLLDKRCNVVFADLALRPEAQELVSNYSPSSQSSAKAVFQKIDVKDWKQLERMFDTANEEFGGADVVCPGAGIYEPVSVVRVNRTSLSVLQSFSNFWHPPGSSLSRDRPDSSRYAVLDINLTHPIRTSQLALSHFLNPLDPQSRSPVSPSNPRHIIHISSIAGQATPFSAAIYNATKHGINGFVRSLALLDKQLGVRVTAVAPGVIKTPLWTENPDRLKLMTESDEWVTPEFVAEVMTDLIEKKEMQIRASLPSTGLNSGDEKGERKTINVEGGLILEVSKGKVRKVDQYLDPVPSGEGNTVGNMGMADEEIFARLKPGKWGVI